MGWYDDMMDNFDTRGIDPDPPLRHVRSNTAELGRRFNQIVREQRIRAAIMAVVKRDWAFSIEIVGEKQMLTAIIQPQAVYALRVLWKRVVVEFNKMEANQCRKA